VFNNNPNAYHSNAPLNVVQEEYKESKLQMEGIGNAEVYFVDDQDSSSYVDENQSSSEATNFKAKGYKNNSIDEVSEPSPRDISNSKYIIEHGSESKAPVGSIEGPVS
jgi:hypothetical protein